MKLKLIEQMRLVVGQCSDMWAQEKFTQLIDRLERATILVAVPQGEAAPIIDMATEFFIHNSVVYRVPEYGFYGVPLGHDGPHYTACHGTSDTIVQPVALVPITEAEV